MEENGQLIQFIFNIEREVIAEKENEWTIYIRGSELLASSNEYAKTYYHYANDEMGSCTHIVDDRKILNQYEYDAWGNVVNQKETVKNRFKFNGQQLDPIIKQYYLRARVYNPVMARFTQEDTYRGDGLNLYAYCANNHVYYVDPSGNTCETQRKIYEETIKRVFTGSKAYKVWDIPEGGVIINGIEYSQHALERMAPNNSSVIAQLSRRAEKILEQNGYKLGTDEYNKFFNKYVYPRVIPPMVVEDALKNGVKDNGNKVGTFIYTTNDVVVITNDLNKVITVIPK